MLHRLWNQLRLIHWQMYYLHLNLSPIIPIFATRYWINILISLYRECSIENFDYYGITDETTCGDYICPLCKLGHDDEEIEGRYKAGSYFIKCEQHEIEIVA